MTRDEFISIWANGSDLSDTGKRNMANDINKVIAAAIAEAVKAEREAAGKAAYNAIERIDTSTNKMRDMTTAEIVMLCADKASAAIRDRNGAK